MGTKLRKITLKTNLFQIYILNKIMKKGSLNNLLKNVQIIVRYCFLEQPYWEAFFNHYFNLGVRKIHVIVQLEDDINSVVNFSPAWPTSGLIAIQFLTNSYDQIYIHGFDGHSKKYKYIHYYDTEETRTSEHAWREGRTDHNLQKEIEYMNYLKEQKKVIELETE